jgi:hypothetical protein
MLSRAKLPVIFGHCTAGNHAPQCPGVVSDRHTTWCDCPCHADPRCSRCGTAGADPTTRRCGDPSACNDTVRARQDANPAHHQLVGVLAEATALQAAQRKLRRDEAAQIRAETSQVDGDQARPHYDPTEATMSTPEKPARKQVSAATARKPKPGLRCRCGCGGTTRGGQFLPGHDARLKAALVGMAKQTGHSDQRSAAAELVARGWTKNYTPTQQAWDAIKQVGGAEALIAKQDAARCGQAPE